MKDTVLKTKYSYLKNNGELLSWFLLGKKKSDLVYVSIACSFS